MYKINGKNAFTDHLSLEEKEYSKDVERYGEVPFARGLAMREGIGEAIAIFDKEASKKLKKTTDVAVVVVDHGVAEIFSV